MARWRNSSNAAASVYETIEAHEEDSDRSDFEHHGAIEGGQHKRTASDDYDLESGVSPSAPPHGLQSRPSSSRSPILSRTQGRQANKRAGRPKWLPKGQDLAENEDADDDVPASLLIEGNEIGLGPGSIALPPPPSLVGEGRPRVTQPNSRNPQLPSEPLLNDGLHRQAPSAIRNFASTTNTDPREKAMWRWTNVVNLDNFLNDVYDYYLYHGFWSIMLRRIFNLMTIAFLLGFTIFLTQCINFSDITRSSKMSDVLVASCTRKMGFLPNLLLWFAVFGWIGKLFQYVLDIRRLRNLHDFYLYLLNISDVEIQSISWQEIVSRLMALRDSNPKVASNTSAKSRRYAITQNKERMDAHDIANRLMRRENYMIAMINKDILDMTLPIPFLRNRQLFTRTLEWNINWCILDYVFNERGQIKQLFLKDTHRKALSDGLRTRFLFAGTANLLFAPGLIFFLLIQNFFTHFNEYQKNPASIGSRDYNVLAQWKFREFNELWHLFRRRINMSHPFASRYIDQFPKDKTIQIARFITFVSGAIVSVLGVATLLDKENFLSFEITHGRTTIFYLGLFGGVWAVARGLIPEENMVYEPEYSMQEVIEFTHYEPAHWKNRLHTVEVKKEFEQLYQMKILMFVEEILSMVFTPFVLWFSLPKCSDRIIDFFREFTVHVDGIGYVCSFAEFKLRNPDANNTNRATSGANGAPTNDPRDDYFASKDHKLEQSYWGFMNDYARNPKADVRLHYRSARRQLNPPPPIPGLPSPTLQTTVPRSVDKHSMLFSPQRAMAFPTGASQLGAQSSTSPLQSMLLDPHHQPSASGFGSSQMRRPRAAGMPGAHSRHHSKRIIEPPNDLIEEDEPQQNGQLPVVQSEGELGSWKYDDAKSDTSEDEDEEATIQEGAGVLGLIRKLQRTQTENNRAATGI